MWSYFKRSKKKDNRIRASESKKASINWCLFIPKDPSISAGVFFSSLSPGIKDCKNGVLYIAPQKSMPKVRLTRLSSYAAREAILEHYGVYSRN